MKAFPNVRQLGAMDCGPACLKIISKFYGKDFSLEYLRDKCQITKLGVSFHGISEAAESIGLKSLAAKLSSEELFEHNSFPCILHWNQNHFVVLYKLTKKRAYISDPAQGNVDYSIKEFNAFWKQNKEQGVALFIEPTQGFDDMQLLDKPIAKDWDFLFFHLKKLKKYFFQLFIGLIVSSLVLLISPYLTQELVDKGIGLKDVDFVYLILFGQLILFLGSSLVEIMRNWLLLRIGAKINVALVSDFFLKLFKLPIQFFDSHLMGDLMQRTNDHKKLEYLLTVKSLSVLFAFINLNLFGIVLFRYNPIVFYILFLGSTIGILWVLLFMKKRAAVDFRLFVLNGQQQSKVIELLGGIEEIKISNSSKQKRWEWEEIQDEIYKVRIKSLTLDQLQHNGFEVILRFTSIILTVITAKLVIEGKISLGTMFAINLIVGQLTNPIYAIVDFIPAWQDAKLAMLRINEVHNQKNEESEENVEQEISLAANIVLKDVSFSYTGSKDNLILKNINLEIEADKVTAIVGSSGSGKTTLLKLLLKFYKPTEGNIKIGDMDFEKINASKWRDKCGVVMQGGKIFSDTIVNNIALGREIDMEQIVMISALANLDDFVNSDLPMGYFTKIGDDGLQLSEGQKQRLLLARAMYKNPHFLFLDEATSSLDAQNEREIMISLNNFGEGKTVLIVAHRLSTVKNAAKIIVLKNGRIVEIGNHDNLTKIKGYYFTLIKEQLELGS